MDGPERARLDVGARIREARLARGLKQRELAEPLGLKARSSVSQWEAGRSMPSLETLVRLAEILQADAGHIAFGEPRTADNVRVAVVEAPAFAEETATSSSGIPKRPHCRFAGVGVMGWTVPRDGLVAGVRQGDVAFFDEGDRAVGASPDRFLLGGQDPVLVEACTAPDDDDEVLVRIGGLQALVRREDLKVVGRIVGMATATTPA